MAVSERTSPPLRSRSVAALLAAVLAVPALAAAPPVSPAPAPRLAVIVVVDGLSWQRLLQYRSLYVAGLRTLLDQGLVAGNSCYRHINTETGPGHASLATGAPPRVHGIVVNEWLEPSPDGAQRPVYCAAQDAAPPALGTVPGPANLRCDTLGDRLVAARPGARVVAVAGKDRAAIFLAGRSTRHLATWFDPRTGRFATSPAYDAAAPAAAAAAPVLAAFDRAEAGPRLAERLGTVWRALTPPPRGGPWAVAGEALADYQVPTNGLLFPHDLAGNRRGYPYAVYTSPFVDELTADLAVALVDDPGLALGRGAAPDLLAVSFSAQDLVSHSYGPESEENLDVLRRLDLQIGRLLAALDARVGRSHYVLAFSADHGFSPIPEYRARGQRGAAAGRLADGPRVAVGAVARLNRLLAQRLGLAAGSRAVAALEGYALYYVRPLPQRTNGGPLTAADLDAALPGAVATLFDEEIAGVYLTAQAASWPGSQPMTEFVRNDFDPARSGDATLVPRPGVLASSDPGRGAGHGSPYEPDTHVPLIFLGGPFAAGHLDAETTPYDLAPTLAATLGVALPAATGRSLAPEAAPPQSRPR